MRSPPLVLDEIDPVNARGLPRGPVRGVGVAIGRRSATADVWIARDGSPVVSFRTARIRHWFRVRATGRRKWQALPEEVWVDCLCDELAGWLCDAMDDEFD